MRIRFAGRKPSCLCLRLQPFPVSLPRAGSCPSRRGSCSRTCSRGTAPGSPRMAQQLQLPNVRFIESDWYGAVPGEPFDAIVANPPYVAPQDPHLREGDLRFEPRVALTPGGDGLAAIRIVVAGAKAHLARGGWLLTEHGYDQAQAVQAMLRAADLHDVETRRDL